MIECAVQENLFSTAIGDHRPPRDDQVIAALRQLERIPSARDLTELITVLRSCLSLIGATSAWFTSRLQNVDSPPSYTSIFSCDPVWACQYAEQRWFEHDPWLRYAACRAEPTLADQIEPQSPEEIQLIRTMSTTGFASAIVAPAPTSHGSALLGVLVVGSPTPGQFAKSAWTSSRALSRLAAMELHDWIVKATANAVMERARLREDEIDLLRHEAMGHGSKFIASLLQTEASTIDCRFQRINGKLGTSSRRSAARLASLYGWI